MLECFMLSRFSHRHRPMPNLRTTRQVPAPSYVRPGHDDLTVAAQIVALHTGHS
jgi:hypothetical protein